ncbi:cell division protein FtsK [bacterium]|nr:cell division protein FtsK [bacterium]
MAVSLSDREKSTLIALRQFLADRVERERALRSSYELAKERATNDWKNARRELKTRIETAYSSLQTEFETIQKEAQSTFDKAKTALATEESERRKSALDTYRIESERTAEQQKHSQWETQATHLAHKSGGKEEYRRQENELHQKKEQIAKLSRETREFLESRRMLSIEKRAPLPSDELLADDAASRLALTVDEAESKLAHLHRLPLPKLVGPRLSLIFIGTFAVLMLITAWFLLLGQAAIVSMIGALVIGGAIAGYLYITARKQVLGIYIPLTELLTRGEHYYQQALADLAANFKKRREELKRTQHRESREIDEHFARRMIEISETKSRILRECDEQYPRLLAERTHERDEAVRAAQRKYPPLLRQLRAEYDETATTLDAENANELALIESDFKAKWNELLHWAKATNDDLRREISDIQRSSQELFPKWTDPSWPERQSNDYVPSNIRFGEFDVAIERLLAAQPEDDALRSLVPASFTWPAFLSFPHKISALFEATGDGLTAANEILENLMLRLLTTVPPSKVRFTIIDPAGLGQDFAAFMHLADHDESLVGNRIWTETGHIEQRLIDLTEHMENVIQKYLRNQYETIEAYNADAGEIAEPYRVLVISRFPTSFTESAFRRLESILAAGARCGVFVLLSVDTKAQLPHGKSLTDLIRHAVHFKWQNGTFQWHDADLGKFPLRFDPAAPAEQMTPILSVIGQRAKKASRVEVPFRVVAPVEAEWWKGDSRREIRVPLGRSGATKLQELSLGPGTSQHALVAGKTGSGKSTMLHALITSAALRYSPDEVEFYLIDFKKGVEFKTYATHALPHARVIAIESEREFGLSVMQRLDQELKIRGDKFRDLGVQDIGGYRDLADRDPKLGPMPRILFVVDEFQEFFVADDKVAQEASLLLDRIVRQGRAFGIHALLGSQTLGGAYSIARSTLGQMAVRIALQCSETDSHLILSEDNTAARLLSRPGEAIYNDANGRIEGNNPFQIVWLPDEERERYLDQLRDKMNTRHLPSREQIVFEGNIPARIERNRQLAAALDAPTWMESKKPPEAWLGDAIEIKDPTSVEFSRQNGSNLLLIGQGDETALSVMNSILLSLSATVAPAETGTATRSAKFYLLDGSLADTPGHGELARIGMLLPHPVRVLNRRDMAEGLSELTDELSQRQLVDPIHEPSLFFFIYDLGRLRDLRRNEDDFGFSGSSSDGEKPKPDKMLATLIKEGPPVGIHVITWCDGLNNLNRTFDRQTLREFGLRILFQMSPSDSSTLIDSPAASRLGQHRAYFHHEDVGRMEKFRPYGAPSEEWLADLKARLLSRMSEAQT